VRKKLGLFLLLMGQSSRAWAAQSEADLPPPTPSESPSSTNAVPAPQEEPNNPSAALKAKPCEVSQVPCASDVTLGFVVGLTHRGMVSETGSFADKLGFEAGLRLLQRTDFTLNVGQMFKNNQGLSAALQGRFFLLKLPTPGGPYLGGGWQFAPQKQRRGFATFGFFGGAGFFYELQFRASHKQPLAVVPAMGLRFPFP
jgi:hypothetical protein